MIWRGVLGNIVLDESLERAAVATKRGNEGRTVRWGVLRGCNILIACNKVPGTQQRPSNLAPPPFPFMCSLAHTVRSYPSRGRCQPKRQDLSSLGIDTCIAQ